MINVDLNKLEKRVRALEALVNKETRKRNEFRKTLRELKKTATDPSVVGLLDDYKDLEDEQELG